MNPLKCFANLTRGLVLGLPILGFPQHCLAWSSGSMPAEAVVVMFSVWSDQCKSDNPPLAPSMVEAFDGWRERNRRYVEQAEKDKTQYEKARSQLKEAYASEASTPGAKAAFERVGCRLLGETWRSPAFDLGEDWYESDFAFLKTGKVSPLLLSLVTITLKEQCVAKEPTLQLSIDEMYKRWRDRNSALVASSEADIDWTGMKGAFPGFFWYRNLTLFIYKDKCLKAFKQLQ